MFRSTLSPLSGGAAGESVFSNGLEDFRPIPLQVEHGGNHRQLGEIRFRFEAEAEAVTTDHIIAQVLQEVPKESMAVA